jgi:DNA-directed RNA polymerase specialized sigma24 family protein
MLKAVQAIASAFAPGRARAERGWSGRRGEWLHAERQRVEQLQARCEALLRAAELDRKEPLHALCARQVGLASAMAGQALAELNERLAGLELATDDETADRVCSGYLAQVRRESERIFGRLGHEVLQLAQSGDRGARAGLEEATGLPVETLLALLGVGSRPGWAEAGTAREEAFQEAERRYQRVVLGRIRARVDNDDDALDLAQESWLRIWQELPGYDPLRASFQAFARYWATIMVLRYYDRRKARRAVEILTSQLIQRFPSFVDQDDPDLAGERLVAGELIDLEPADYAELYSELLRITFGSDSPPHQLIAFGFSKVGGWTPRRIDAELAAIPLSELEARLERDYLAASQLPAELVAPAFAPLRVALGQPFEAAVHDQKTRATFPELRTRLVGGTVPRDYYTSGSPSADISHWWAAVRRRVREAVQRSGPGPLFELHRTAARRAARKVAAGRIAGRDSGDA